MAKTTSARGDLENFIDGLGIETRTTVHVNGKDHPTALVVVDFGYPTPTVRLTSEQSVELTSKLRKFARGLLNYDANIRVGTDNYLGLVYWAYIQ